MQATKTETVKTAKSAPRVSFPLGHVVATPGAIEALAEHYGNRWREGAHGLLRRHQRGDWGDICPEDRGLNERSLEDGTRLLSVYKLPQRVPGACPVKLWIITEADRSATTLLLPDEY